MRFLSTIILLIGLFNFTRPVWAQSAANAGQIVGQVLDPTGASVGGADVVVRNKDTNFSRSTTTDAAGGAGAWGVPVPGLCPSRPEGAWRRRTHPRVTTRRHHVSL